MAFDGVMLRAVSTELQRELLGARIDRVLQPERDEIHLLLRQPGKSLRLLLSAQPEEARLHLTRQVKPNPSSPPLFCMVLRKHLEGGKITALEQPGLERVLRIRVDSTSELGDPVKRTLVCEIMGRHSNIILLDEASGQIIDGIRRYSHEVSRHREVLPDRPYVAPPDQGKIDLLSMDGSGERLTRILLDMPEPGPLWRALFEKIEGLSPLLARELVCRSGLTPQTSIEECGAYEFDRLNQAVRWLQETVLAGSFQPNLVTGNTPAAGELDLNTRLVEFAAVPLLQYAGEDYRICCYESPSELLEACYRIRQLQRRWRGLYQELSRVIQASREKAFGKLALRQDSLRQIEQAEEFKRQGDLIMTFLYRIKPGMEEIRLPDLYGSEEEISISLSPLLTPIQNAQEYYRRYSRARRSQAVVKRYLEESRQEVEYLESVGQALAMASTLQELQEIREELVEQGYLRAPSDQAKKSKRKGKPLKDKDKEKITEVSPARFLSSDGYEILVGKNNRQNDFLTMKLARKGDIWLHAKDLPGAHVVIRVRSRQPAEGGDLPVPDRTLMEAAGLAAYFSRGRHASKVSVDYTRRQNVRKPGGSPPGKVVYDNYRTLLVNPQLIAEFQSEKTS